MSKKGAAPFKYIITIDMDSADAVEAEMARPEWEGFINDFEDRTKNHAFVAQQILSACSNGTTKV